MENMAQVVTEILQEVGILEQARDLVSNDQELVELFTDDFNELINRAS